MIKYFATLPVLYAGIVHLYISVEHIEHALAHGIFFVGIGIIQIAWAIRFLSKRSEWLYYMGLALSGGILVLWVITRILPAPFEGAAGPIDYWGVFVAFMEAVAFIGLMIYAKQSAIPHFRPKNILSLIGKALVIGSLTGSILFLIGDFSDAYFPALQAEEGDIHEDGELHKD